MQNDVMVSEAKHLTDCSLTLRGNAAKCFLSSAWQCMVVVAQRWLCCTTHTVSCSGITRCCYPQARRRSHV